MVHFLICQSDIFSWFLLHVLHKHCTNSGLLTTVMLRKVRLHISFYHTCTVAFQFPHCHSCLNNGWRLLAEKSLNAIALTDWWRQKCCASQICADMSVSGCYFYFQVLLCCLLWMNVGWGRLWLTSTPTSHLKNVSKCGFSAWVTGYSDVPYFLGYKAH